MMQKLGMAKGPHGRGAEDPEASLLQRPDEDLAEQAKGFGSTIERPSRTNARWFASKTGLAV